MEKIAIFTFCLCVSFVLHAQNNTVPENKQTALVVKSDSNAVKSTVQVKKFDTSKIQHKSVLAPKEQKYVVPSAAKVDPNYTKTVPAATKVED